jgi:hypothetical protein
MTDETATLVEPGGWLAEHQRAHCAGATALTTYQGLICDEIVLPQSAADAKDPARLVLAANGFVDAAQNRACLIVGEFAPEALWSFYAHDYISIAKLDGHAKYFARRGADPIALRSCGAALKSMLADPHLEIFNLMLRLKRGRPRDARRFAAQAGYSSIVVALRDLDKRLVDLERKEPLAPRHKTWLKSFRKTTIVPDAELGQNMQRIAAANPMFAARRAEADRIRAEAQRKDPAYKAARSLCEMAGLQFAALGQGEFAPMREVWPDGPARNAYCFRVETNRGPRMACFYSEGGLFKRRLSVLIQPGESLPLGSLSLSRGDYDAIVPGR